MSSTTEPPENPQTDIPEKDRIPFKQKLAYSIGITADHYAQHGIGHLLLPIFNGIFHLSPTWTTAMLAISRLWDAITDPVVGSLSDNCKSKFGRRKPFLFWGSILTGCAFPLVWLVPESWGDIPTLIYLGISLLIFYSCFSIMSVPYESLGMELTPNYYERTNLLCFRGYVATITDLGTPYLLVIANLAIFSSPLAGVRVVGVAVGLTIIALGIMPAIHCQERYANVAKNQGKQGAIASLLALKGNRPLIIIVSAITLFLMAATSVQALDYYVHTYYIYGGDTKLGALLTAYNYSIPVVFGLLGTFSVQILSKRYEKHKLLLVAVGIMFFCKLGLFVTYVPGHPYMTLITKPFWAFSMSSFWILILSMRADVADWDEYTFGKRREGMIAAVNNWMVKVAITIAIVLGGVILEHVTGFRVELEGNQAPETLTKLKFYYAAIPSVAVFFVFLILLKYPLTKKKLEDIRTELETRRDAV